MVDNGNAGADDSRFSEVVSQLLIWMTRCPGGVRESCVGLYHHPVGPLTLKLSVARREFQAA